MKGLLISLEGPDGAGRTVHARQLLQWFAEQGREATLLRLKGSPLAREALRELQRHSDIGERAMFLLYAADLADLLHFEAEPALNAGRVVLFDRYTLTPTVRAAMGGVDPLWARNMLSFAPSADLTIVLHAPARQRVERLLSRRRFLQPREAGALAGGSGDVLQKALRYQRRIARLYRTFAQEENFAQVDAARDPKVVQSEIRRVTAALLALRGSGV